MPGASKMTKPQFVAAMAERSGLDKRQVTAVFDALGALIKDQLGANGPGELTVQYLAGRRKHYVLPLRLYLTISLLALLAMRLTGQVDLVGGLDRPEVVAAERGPLPTLMLDARGVRIGIKEGVFVCERLPGFVCSLLRERAATDARTFLHKLRQANERVLAHLGTVMFVLLPLFAACLWLVHRRTRMRYTAHLVFALHLHSFWFLALALAQLARPPLAWAGVAVVGVYTLMAGRRVYGGRWWQRALRALLLAAMYAVLLAVTVPLAWLLALVA